MQLCYAALLVLGALLGLPPCVVGGDAGGSAVASIESTGASGQPEAAPIKYAQEEDACCSAILLEGGGGSVGQDGMYILPQDCLKHRVGCPALGFPADDAGKDNESGAEMAFQQQTGLRSSPACSPGEWKERCSRDSVMLLIAGRKSGTCLAAGCVPVQGLEGSAMAMEVNYEDEEPALLRAVTAQQLAVLEEASRGFPTSFFSFTKTLRKAFVKEQTRLLSDLKSAMKTPLPHDIESIRSLIELAAVKGFRGAQIDEATMLVRTFDREQEALAWLRRMPAVLVSKWVKSVVRTKKAADSQQHQIASLAKEVQDLKSEMSDLERAAADDVHRLRADLAMAGKMHNEVVAREQVLVGSLAEHKGIAAAETDRYEAALASAGTRETDLIGLVDTLTKTAIADTERFQAELAVAETREEEGLLRISSLESTIVHQRQAIRRQDLNAIDKAESCSTAIAIIQAKLAVVAQEAEGMRRTIEILAQEGQDSQKRLQSTQSLLEEQTDAMEVAAESHGKVVTELEEEMAILEHDMDETGFCLDSCTANLRDLHDLSANLTWFVAVKSYFEGALLASDDMKQEPVSVPPMDMQVCPAMDEKCERTRFRFSAIRYMVDSYADKIRGELEICKDESQQLRQLLSDCADQVQLDSSLAVVLEVSRGITPEEFFDAPDDSNENMFDGEIVEGVVNIGDETPPRSYGASIGGGGDGSDEGWGRWEGR